MRLARTLTAVTDALRNGRLRDYLGILVVGSGARMFGLASQFVVLLMLSRFLPKDSFGHLMVALGFYRLIGIALGVGGSLVLLFHVSRHPDDRHAEIKLQRFSALMTRAARRGDRGCGIFAAGPVTQRARQALARSLAAGDGAVSGFHDFAHRRDRSLGGPLARRRIDLLGRGRAQRGAARVAAAGSGLESAATPMWPMS